jgi:hypothetical protein
MIALGCPHGALSDFLDMLATLIEGGYVEADDSVFAE